MMANIGAIVKLDGFNWVVANPVPSPSGAPWVRLLRNTDNGYWTPHVTGLAGLEVVETPAYSIGQKVRVGRLPGAIIAMNEDESVVAYEPFREPLRADPGSC